MDTPSAAKLSKRTEILIITLALSVSAALFFIVPVAILCDLTKQPFPKMKYTLYWLFFAGGLYALSYVLEYAFTATLPRFRQIFQKCMSRKS